MLDGEGVAVTKLFRLDKRGVRGLLQGQLGAAATAKAREMAEVIRSDYPDLADAVDVEEYRTDRGAASVMVQDPSARELQIRDGLLTRAAARVGLEVKTS